MKKIVIISVVLVLSMAVFAGVVGAQEHVDGTIRGAVYQDVNGDGKCVNTGVAGEEPVAGVNLEFTNTGGDWTVTLQSGENGTYGLVAAGFGYWRVTAQPNSDWVVTSPNPLYTAIDKDNFESLDNNFCVSRGLYYTPVLPVQPIYPGQPSAPAVLPESGAAAQSGGMETAVFALAGLALISLGVGLEIQRRRS